MVQGEFDQVVTLFWYSAGAENSDKDICSDRSTFKATTHDSW